MGEELSRNNWAAAYSLSINPAGDEVVPTPEDDTLASLLLAPPNTRRPPGRPKKIRILSRGEFKVCLACILTVSLVYLKLKVMSVRLWL